MRLVNPILVFLSLLFILGFAEAGIIHVDDDNTAEPWDGTQEHSYQYIQDGIDAASDEDTVLVADGIYNGDGNRDLDFKGKAITVTSKNGAEATIIDCEGLGRAFYFHSGETSASTVSGFTITNGSAINGYIGAIFCGESSPTIKDNVITNNSAGGIYCHTKTAPIIDGNIISKNTTNEYGGGIVCAGSSAIISNNEIIANTANDTGGGIVCLCCSPTITSNRIIGNSTGLHGGGIGTSSSHPIISNNEIIANTANECGGGVFLAYYSHPTMINNTICENSSGLYGGGICLGASYPTDATVVFNTILWDNSPDQIFVCPVSWMDITYSNIQGAWTGEGNIDADPLFVDPDSDDYRLSDDSPCIGAGTRTPDMPHRDILGKPRPSPSYSKPDIGAYESPLRIGYPPWDVNSDRLVDILDLTLVGQYLGKKPTLMPDMNSDVNGDGIVNILDIALVAKHFGESYTLLASTGNMLSVEPDHLPVLVKMRGIIEDNPYSNPDFATAKRLLDRLISSVGIKTEILQNYPNPFNPETWIPYRLRNQASVLIRIHNAAGQLVKTLDIGHRDAGVYVSRSRAAYWNGKNEAGEFVASDVYFYSIQAGEYNATRKMVVQK